MGYAFEMFFDIETENKIREIWEILSKKRLSSFMLENGGKPHISLSVYNNLDIETANKKLSDFCKNHKAFDLVLGFPGSFISNQNVIFIAPIINEDLMNIHSDFHKQFNDINKEMWNFYSPNDWQPHCTLTMETPEELYLDTFDEVRKNFVPIKTSIQSIGLVEFRPIKVINEYRLE